MSTGLRLPDFLIIGTMKSGTTTLFNWLDAHPDVQMPRRKEPNFFCADGTGPGALRDYAACFAGIPPGRLTGEASVRYTDPRLSAVAASRAHRVVPGAALVCVLRDPVERLRSHYRHEVQRGRERHRFPDAMLDPARGYVARSCYARALTPWVQRFGPHRLHAVRFEDLFGSEAEWARLLAFLELSPVPRPAGTFNVTADKSTFSPLMSRLWDAGWVSRAPRPPRMVRRAARAVLLRSPEASAALTASAHEDVPAEVLQLLRSQVEELRALLSAPGLDWDLAEPGA